MRGVTQALIVAGGTVVALAGLAAQPPGPPTVDPCSLVTVQVSIKSPPGTRSTLNALVRAALGRL